MAKRVSISSREAASGAAADLVALLQNITDDGRVGTEEVRALHAWLVSNRDCELPGADYLKITIESIAKDGRITPEERVELAKAIEKVLPPELRDFAKQKRRLREMTERQAERDAQQAAAAEAAARQPVGSLDFLVAGVAYEGRSAVVATMREGDPVFLARDRGNRHSPNAIEVRTRDGRQLGFVPESEAVSLAPYLDSGYRLRTSVKHLWRGRQQLIPIIEGDVYPPSVIEPGSYSPNEIPPRAASAKGKLGCFACLLLAPLLLPLSQSNTFGSKSAGDRTPTFGDR